MQMFKLSNLTLTFANIIYPLIFPSHKKYKLYSTNKLKFWYRPKTADKLFIWETLKSKVYTKHFPIQSKDVVVDLGANIGEFTVLAGKKAKRVIAYEPSPTNFTLLQKNAHINNLHNLTLINKAVSHKNGTSSFHISKTNTGGHSLLHKNPPKHHQNTIHVPTITLPQLFKNHSLQHIGFLKIDIEGAEYLMLLNTPKKYLKKIDRIALEYHNNCSQHYTHFDLINKLKNSNFKIQLSLPKLVQNILPRGVIYAHR